LPLINICDKDKLTLAVSMVATQIFFYCRCENFCNRKKISNFHDFCFQLL